MTARKEYEQIGGEYYSFADNKKYGQEILLDPFFLYDPNTKNLRLVFNDTLIKPLMGDDGKEYRYVCRMCKHQFLTVGLTSFKCPKCGATENVIQKSKYTDGGGKYVYKSFEIELPRKIIGAIGDYVDYAGVFRLMRDAGFIVRVYPAYVKSKKNIRKIEGNENGTTG